MSMSLTHGAIDQQIHPSGEARSALGNSTFTPRNQVSAGKILQIDLTAAKSEQVLPAGTRVSLQLDDGITGISLPGHSGSVVSPYNRENRSRGNIAELILLSPATIVDGKLLEQVRAKLADDRSDCAIRYHDGSQKIVNNKLGLIVAIAPGSHVSQQPQRLSEAA